MKGMVTSLVQNSIYKEVESLSHSNKPQICHREFIAISLSVQILTLSAGLVCELHSAGLIEFGNNALIIE